MGAQGRCAPALALTRRYTAFHPQVQLHRSNVRTAPIHCGKRSSLRETRERSRSNWALKTHLLKAEKQERRHTLYVSPLLFGSGDRGGGGAPTARPRSARHSAPSPPPLTARPGPARCPRWALRPGSEASPGPAALRAGKRSGQEAAFLSRPGGVARRPPPRTHRSGPLAAGSPGAPFVRRPPACSRHCG